MRHLVVLLVAVGLVAVVLVVGVVLMVGVVVVVVVVVQQRRRRRRAPRRSGRVAEAPVLGQRRHRAERLAAPLAPDLQPAVGVHPLMTTQIRKLKQTKNNQPESKIHQFSSFGKNKSPL